jgi:hypothetical protein
MSLNVIDHLILIMETGCVLFEVRTECSNIIYVSFGFRCRPMKKRVGNSELYFSLAETVSKYINVVEQSPSWGAGRLIMMGWDYVSEPLPPTGLLFISQAVYERGQLWWWWCRLGVNSWLVYQSSLVVLPAETSGESRSNGRRSENFTYQ